MATIRLWTSGTTLAAGAKSSTICAFPSGFKVNKVIGGTFCVLNQAWNPDKRDAQYIIDTDGNISVSSNSGFYANDTIFACLTISKDCFVVL